MGKKWTEQELSGSVLDVIDKVREDMRDGTMRFESWDHNATDRVPGRSNKQIRIAGAALLNTKDCTQEEAEQAVLEAVLGRKAGA